MLCHVESSTANCWFRWRKYIEKYYYSWLLAIMLVYMYMPVLMRMRSYPPDGTSHAYHICILTLYNSSLFFFIIFKHIFFGHSYATSMHIHYLNLSWFFSVRVLVRFWWGHYGNTEVETYILWFISSLTVTNHLIATVSLSISRKEKENVTFREKGMMIIQ